MNHCTNDVRKFVVASRTGDYVTGGLDTEWRPAHRDPIAPTRLVDPSSKHEPPRLEIKTGSCAHRDQERKTENHKEAHEANAHEIVKQRQNLVLPTRNQVEHGEEGVHAEVHQELHPAAAPACPVGVEHGLHAEQEAGHERRLRRCKRPPPERINPGTEVRGEPPRRRVPEPQDPVCLPQRRGHAATEFTQGDNDTHVAGRHEAEPPEDADGAAVGQAAGKVL